MNTKYVINRDRKAVKEAQKKLEKVFNGAFKRFKSQAKEEVLNIRKAAQASVANYNFFNNEIKEIQEALAELAADGVDSAAEQITLMGFNSLSADALHQANAAASSFARLMGGDLVTNVEDSVKKGIGDIVADGLDSGATNTEIAQELSDSYLFSDSRSETIARTETAYADVAGNVQTYQKAGVNKKIWILGSGACDICNDNANQGAIDFDDYFQDGSYSPPGHPNCRCDILPVFDEDDSD